MPVWVTIPNVLTLLRLALVPFVIAAVLAGRHTRALELFLLAGFTDLIDGAVARHFRSSTQAGAYLDPIADKCLLSGTFFALAAARIVPWWFVLLVFGRDLYILAGVAILMLKTRNRNFPPSRWGKFSTFFQIAAAVAWMVRNAVPGPLLDAAATTLLWASAAFTLASGIHYTWRGAQLLRSH
jgi:cardiolipin synthase